MSAYLIRRLIQMAFVLLLSSMVTYALLYLAPGGPLQGLRQNTDPKKRLTEEDIARIRAQFEMDLDMQWRYTRWLIGFPSGPILIGGQDIFNTAEFIVGCRKPLEQTIEQDGKYVTLTTGCKEYVRMKDLEGRPRTSKGVLFGDFGSSWSILRDRPISLLVSTRLPRTIQLMSSAIFLSLLIGVPLGIFSAIRQYSTFDYTVTTLSFVGQSMPTFFFGIILILVLSVGFKAQGWFYLPPGNAEGVRDYVLPVLGKIEAKSLTDNLLRMVMPVSVLTMVNVAGWSRFVRASMLEVMRQDYVRTARAKGLIERLVIMKHALRNALIPFITIVVFAIPAIFGGAIITETVFNWPGMGRLYIDALTRNDYPVAMTLLLLTAVLTVFATLLSDVLYTIVDPRIRLS